MTDLTQLEQRFRMANPVPDPANPPMSVSTAATALLDLDERRGTMQTQETQTPVAKPPKRQKRLIAAGVAFAGVVAAAGIALWIASSNDDRPPAVEPPPITEAVAPVGDPAITFDEATLTCSYTGPTEFQYGVQTVFTAVNDSEIEVNFMIVPLHDGLTLNDIVDGTRNPEYLAGPGAGVRLPEEAADPTINRLSAGVLEGTVADNAGTWLIACGNPFLSAPEFDHAVDTFEVVGGP